MRKESPEHSQLEAVTHEWLSTLIQALAECFRKLYAVLRMPPPPQTQVIFFT